MWEIWLLFYNIGIALLSTFSLSIHRVKIVGHSTIRYGSIRQSCRSTCNKSIFLGRPEWRSSLWRTTHATRDQSYKTFYGRSKAGAYPSKTPFSTPLDGRLLNVSMNIKLGSKGRPAINTLAYYEHW